MISNIRAERCRIDMTQDELGARLGTTGRCVRSWEAGDTSPSSENILTMSDLFGCSTDWLLGKTDERLPRFVAR